MRSAQATLIYDGDCSFCRRWVDRVGRWDRHRRLDLVPYQTADLEARFPSVTRTQCAERSHLIGADGTVYRGAAAGREVLRRLPAGWLWVLPFYLPGGLRIAERIYLSITHRWGPLGSEPPAT
jgi:predicted DCC family thiol-disulfide oxidoreductase YuxK